ncbi:hypothetical protein, conserved [Trypanosoma brucei brucei TREU927]|uniref:C-type lectin domain-containing protein n=1 Tax=Trypanosoma brucei brucei (strain 927/4 GUTat10.1) TaxID=185431 RepID=Q581E6_TRYB2|nr:hypothetical protein, conserved [Trypanosoma brucei brucei TREU927]XP_845162.1 hypothetical protein, conserved [Trypanosoma brucei brucei TREU927]AAX79585.1 hypothetical protein, conserved [Trypanosoma brucei]AAX79586.1 hypothetical protein, conserved [Trypanosoma brucei]AAZ11602.1 hypothetical protein, conserved [Trypanosoma brucei brucei TREU927]AAZ11603.1 hypothetical protein, conserved [Trypanosoma brucei brucei TREU927]
MGTEISMTACGFARMVVLFTALLQCLSGSSHLFAFGKVYPTAYVKEYILFPNRKFWHGGDYLVDYSNSVHICREAGGTLATDHSQATNERLTAYHLGVADGPFIYSYLGGDATYSASAAQDAGIRCTAGDYDTSLNCVYRWNSGLFEASGIEGNGVAFWRGSYTYKSGSGALGGYPSFFAQSYPQDGQLHVMGWYTNVTKWFGWFDGGEVSGNKPGGKAPGYKSLTYFAALCEVTVPQPSHPVPGNGNSTANEELAVINESLHSDEESTNSQDQPSATPKPKGEAETTLTSLSHITICVGGELCLLIVFFSLAIVC